MTTKFEKALQTVISQMEAEGDPYAQTVKDAMKMLADPNRVVVTYCRDCEYWIANNAEEGDWSGKCTKDCGMCEGKTVDAFLFCADGEERQD